MDEMVLLIMRRMSWQRAKGELKALLETYLTDLDITPHGQYEELEKKIEEFVKGVEENW